MNYQETYQEWFNNPYFDEATKEELKNIQDDDNEIKERFYSDLAFGTAGLRGIIGAGINRMNIYVVRKATQGLADYILEQGTDKKRVTIAFDSCLLYTSHHDKNDISFHSALRFFINL